MVFTNKVECVFLVVVSSILPIRNSDHMTIGKTHSTLLILKCVFPMIIWSGFRIGRGDFVVLTFDVPTLVSELVLFQNP